MAIARNSLDDLGMIGLHSLDHLGCSGWLGLERQRSELLPCVGSTNLKHQHISRVFVDVIRIFISSLLFAPAVGVAGALHLAGMVEGLSHPQNCLGSGAQRSSPYRPIPFTRSPAHPLWSGQQQSCACDCCNGDGDEKELECSCERTVFELVDGRKQSESDEADSEHIEESAHFAPRRGRASLLRPMTRRRYAF